MNSVTCQRRRDRGRQSKLKKGFLFGTRWTTPTGVYVTPLLPSKGGPSILHYWVSPLTHRSAPACQSSGRLPPGHRQGRRITAMRWTTPLSVITRPLNSSKAGQSVTMIKDQTILEALPYKIRDGLKHYPSASSE